MNVDERVRLLREAINIAVLEMSEDGTLNNLKRQWWYNQSECRSNATKVCLHVLHSSVNSCRSSH